MFVKPNAKLVHWAERLAPYAEKAWVNWFFGFFFFIDSFVMFIPIDGLMVITLVFVPKKIRMWFLSGLLGALIGYVAIAFLTQSSFQHYIMSWIDAWGYTQQYKEIVVLLAEHGYAYMAALTFTFMPQNICLVGSVLVGLDPVLVLIILILSKLFKMSWMYYAALRFRDMILGVHEKWKEKNLRKNQMGGS